VVGVFPCGLISSYKYIVGEFGFADFAIYLVVVWFDVDAIRAPLLPVRILITGEEHDASKLAVKDILKDLSRLF
jgi:hypothetical protein